MAREKNLSQGHNTSDASQKKAITAQLLKSSLSFPLLNIPFFQKNKSCNTTQQNE